jgi:hypothetical protein
MGIGVLGSKRIKRVKTNATMKYAIVTPSASSKRPIAQAHADCRDEPDGRSGRQSLDPVLAHKNKTGADRADSSDDLCSDAGWVENHKPVRENISEAVL